LPLLTIIKAIIACIKIDKKPLDKTKGEYTLQRINYGNNSVRLTYADRSDTHTSYLAGSKLQQTKRLNNITTYANNNSVRTYGLEYQYYGTPKRSQLTSIEECVSVSTVQ
jgi:hypothetical protein